VSDFSFVPIAEVRQRGDLTAIEARNALHPADNLKAF
jgi:hypothetical protein